MLKITVIIAAVLIAALLVFAATRPDAFRIERDTTIEAAPARILALINDFHHWHSWSPYEERDPAMTRSFSGAASGRGAIYAWNGDAKVGEGCMEITQSAPSGVVIQLDFVRPFRAHNVAEFTLRPDGDGTVVSWAMRGSNSYAAKLMGVFFDMDRMVGKDFEAGLANLKAAAEK